MRWRQTSSGLTAMVFMLGAVALIDGCSKEAPQATEAEQASHSPVKPSGQKAPDATSHARSGPPQNLEFQPFDRRLLEHAGTLDRTNRYAATVMVAPQGPALGGECSGVLLHPRLALTAAHCVCPRRQTALPEGGLGTIIDRTACAERASVTTVAYVASENPERPTLQIRSYEGQVRPHPSFRILLDASGAERTNDADLSVIWLDRPVELPHLGVRLADSEVQAQESLIMAGYGHDRIVGSRHGARYFRKNLVARVPTPPEGRALYAQQGSSLYEGFDGGPCFREEGQERRLVGIAGLSTHEGLSFTSTFFHQDWLRSEVQRAEAARTAESPASP